MNATGTGFEVKDVRQVMDFKIFESALGSLGVISSIFWTPLFRITKIFHVSYSITFYPFLFHFYISCVNQPRIRETKRQLALVLNSRTEHSLWIFGFLNLHLEVRE